MTHSLVRVLVAVPVILACATAAAAPAVPVEGPMPPDFARTVERIAARHDCPPSVLWAIAVVRSGGFHRATPARDGAVGLTGLVPHGTPSLELAASLAGVPRDVVRRDPEANLTAAAALLALMYAQQPSTDDDAVRWVRASAGFAGGDDPVVVHLFLSDVLDAMARPDVRAGGDARVRFEPLVPDREAVLAPWPLLQSRAAEYPGALWVSAYAGSTKPGEDPEANFTIGRGGNDIDYIIVHVMQGSYAGSISWFQNPKCNASAHYMLRSSDGQITQMVAEGNTAWHAGNWSYNQRSIGIEHEGYINAPDTWFTEAMYQASADLVAHLCDKYGIPKDRQHILGHNEVPDPDNSALFGGAGHHTDPGAYWDWDHYMDLINGVEPPLETGSLVGYVREYDIYTGAAIHGATVKLSNGSSAVTSAGGYYSFAELPVGDYTVTASANGYVTKSDTKYVAAGIQNWKSIALQKVTCTPSCAGRECGPDGCGGMCGQCAEDEVCTNGACGCLPDDHRGCCGDAVCSFDSCGNQDAQIEACPFGCADGSCMTCQPNCFLSDCGADGCGGSCGTCSGGQECKAGLCVCVPEDEQDCCLDAICWFDSCDNQGAQVAACEHGCANGACLDCTPSCDGLSCGPDGCGGLCGTCAEGRQCVSGACVCTPNDHKACCGSDVCWFDSCGTSEGLDADCKYGCLDGTCTSCYPACDGLECGTDGCGGSCGTCGAGKTCSAGACVCKPKDHKGCCGSNVCWFDGCGGAGEQVATCPYDCLDAKCTGCSPQCDGQECGADGCGGECGTCPSNESCRYGKCECDPQDHKSCVGNSVYWFDSCDVQGEKIVDCPAGCTLNACLDCTAQCQGAECGPDGCGGECGACPSGEVCVDALCIVPGTTDTTTGDDVPPIGNDPGATGTDLPAGEGSGHYNERDTGTTPVATGASSGGCTAGAAASPIPALAFLLTTLAALRRRRR